MQQVPHTLFANRWDMFSFPLKGCLHVDHNAKVQFGRGRGMGVQDFGSLVGVRCSHAKNLEKEHCSILCIFITFCSYLLIRWSVAWWHESVISCIYLIRDLNRVINGNYRLTRGVKHLINCFVCWCWYSVAQIWLLVGCGTNLIVGGWEPRRSQQRSQK